MRTPYSSTHLSVGVAHDVGEEVANLNVEQQVHDRDQVEADGEGLAGLRNEVEESASN